MKPETEPSPWPRPRPQDGKDNTWQEFFLKYDPLIISVIAWPKWRFPRDLRDDLAQVIRREIVKALPHFEQKSNLTTFVKRICIHRCIDEIRRLVRERTIMVEVRARDEETDAPRPEAKAGEEFDPVATIVKAERAVGIRKTLETMDATCRTAIHDFYIRDLSYKEMAQIHGIAVNTVGSRLAKCLQKLRESLKDDPHFRDL
jgi:RNA polymerase sigma-70 factor, ECF subfamily